MWSDILNKPKSGTPFRKDRAKLMNVPIGYADNVERLNTHLDLLPKDKCLGTTGIKRSRVHSRSVLGDIDNTVPRGIRRNGGSKSSGNGVSWSEVVRAGSVL